ncbi:MAG: class I SAM-dependent methyltransferase [Oscillochloridaceae bacterium umkhey_bin13]
MDVVTCTLCGNEQSKLVCEGYDRDIPTNTQTYHFMQCTRCKLVWLTPRATTPDELAAIYPPSYDSYIKQDQTFLMLLRRIAWQDELREIINLTSSSSHILEIGSATGEFLHELQRKGRKQLLGIDLSEHAAKVARERYGIDVRSGELDDLNLTAQNFDLVIMRHVLEHVSNPLKTLRYITSILKPNGYCIFTIPNIDSHTMRIFGKDWYGYQFPRHFHLFPNSTLALLLKLSGLDLKATVYITTPNIWIGSSRFALERRKFTRLAKFMRYQNPLAIALFAPLGIYSAAIRSSGVIRIVAQRAKHTI